MVYKSAVVSAVGDTKFRGHQIVALQFVIRFMTRFREFTEYPVLSAV